MNKKWAVKQFIGFTLIFLMTFNLLPFNLYGAHITETDIESPTDIPSTDEGDSETEAGSSNNLTEEPEDSSEDSSIIEEEAKDTEWVPNEDSQNNDENEIDSEEEFTEEANFNFQPIYDNSLMNPPFSTSWIVTSTTLTSSYNSLEEAMAAINNDSGTVYSINIPVSGSENLQGELLVNSDKELTISSPAGSPYTIYSSSSEKHFTVSGKLTLENIILDGQKGNGGIEITSGGTLNIEEGAVIQNIDGFGVSVSASDAVLNMNGGIIANNLNSGVSVSNGTFNMSGGIISGNQSAGNGGGIVVSSSGTLNLMGNSEISGNTAVNGGGIYINNKALEITDNVLISNNTAENRGGGIYIMGEPLTISGGIITENRSINGGGLYVGSTFVTMTSGEIYENTASGTGSNSGNGGGLYLGTVTLTMTGGEIRDNHAINSNSGGGGIYATYSSINLNGGKIIDNDTDMSGGGIYLLNQNHKITINDPDSEISGNTAAKGGGIYVDNSSTVTLNQGKINNNTTTGYGNGGGIYFNSNSILTMTGGEINNNEAGYGGGIVLSGSGGNSKITGGEISGNTAFYRYGGGIVLMDGKITITDAEINGNKAVTAGGGIYVGPNWSNTATPELIVNSGTISNNSAADGGGIYTNAIYNAKVPHFIKTTIAPSVEFKDNKAEHQVSSDFNLAGISANTIKSTSASGAYPHPINNADIFYPTYVLTYNVNGGNEDGPAQAKGLLTAQLFDLDNQTIPTHDITNGLTVNFRGWSKTLPAKIYDADETLPEVITSLELSETITGIKEDVVSGREVKVYALWQYGDPPQEFEFIIQAEHPGGSITQGTNGQYLAGHVIDISALADADYTFDKWISDNGGDFDDINNSDTTFTMPAANVTVTATFTKNEDNGNNGGDNNGGDNNGGDNNGGDNNSGGSNTGNNNDSDRDDRDVSLPIVNKPAEEIFEEIENESHIAYLFGYPDGTVKQNQTITRGETAAVIYRLMNSHGTASQNYFLDVNDNSWYSQSINYLASIGILSGYPDGTFRPDNPITRAEFAALTAHYGNLELSGTKKFNDVSDTHWAAAYICTVYEKGWITGYPDGTYRPEENITRGEAVTIINTIFNRKADSDTLLLIENPYIDISPDHWAYAQIIEASAAHEYYRNTEGNETWILW